MQPDFWHARWRSGQIGFHQSAVDRNLRERWPQLKLAASTRVFVPLCGKSLDLLWLLEQGHCVTGVEISALALESFFMERGIPAKRRVLAGFDLYQAERLDLYCGDFLALTPALLGTCDAVYDRAALISWMPELRAPYVEHMTALTAPGTQTLLITMEYSQAQMSGPPFSVGGDEVESLYARHHSIERLCRHDILENEPRFRERGVTQMHEVCYRMIRL